MTYFAGLGHYVPKQKVTNANLEKLMGLKPGWIEQRTGIHSRFYADENESLTSMAENAARMALENSSLNTNDIAMVLLATSTPDHLLPPTAPLLAHRLQLNHTGAFDIAGACCGFLYALTIADSLTQVYQQPVLIVAANILSRRINFSERNSAVIFGDAAAAVVIQPSMSNKIESKLPNGMRGINFQTDGSAYPFITIPAGGSLNPFAANIPENEYKMSLQNGKLIFKHAIDLMVSTSQKALQAANITAFAIQHFVPHQANGRIIENVLKQLDISNDINISTLANYGNTSAASIPLSLSLANSAKPFQTGEKILMTAAGAGMTAGAVVVEV